MLQKILQIPYLMRLNFKAILPIIFALSSLVSQAQELNCRLQINSQKIKGTNRQMFTTMRTTLFEFMNNTRWTNDIYSQEERIECNITLNLTEKTGDTYKGNISIKSSRPIYRTSYNSQMLNIIDSDVRFEYIENETLEFNEHNHGSNLVAILAYYAYIIIGIDYDTYSTLGGETHYLKAKKICDNAQSDQKANGWKSFEGTFNRFWLVENLLHNDFKPLRNALHMYHLNGLDILTEQTEMGRDEITSALFEVKKSANKKQNSYLTKVFFDAKADEITKIYSDGFITNKNELVDMLKQIDPANSNKWDRILEDSQKSGK